MNTHDQSDADLFSIEELEARFEMEALNAVAGAAPGLDWKCTCSVEA